MMRLIMVLMLSMLPAIACGADADNTNKRGGNSGDAAKGESIARQVCAACHGIDGNSPLAMNPILAAQHSGYLYKQLMNFKSGARNNAIMTAMSVNLSDEDMRNLAAFYAKQSAIKMAAKNMKLVAVGQKLYRAGIPDKGVPACAGCHSPDGSGIPPQYPRISGQHTDYTAAQLRAFAAGERYNDQNSMMRMIASRLNEVEIRALAEYVSGLH